MSVRRSIFRALCLATLLGLGIQVVYAVVIFWVGSVAYQLIPSRSPAEHLQILADGTPVIVTYTPTEYYSQTARTLDGKPVAREELENIARGVSLAGIHPPRFVQRGWPGRIRAFNDGREPAVYWYFVHTGERTGYGHFVGYDSKLKLRVGYIGAGGFRRDKPPPEEWFPVDGRRVTSRSHITSSVPYYYSYGEPRYSYSVAPHEPMQTWMVYMVSNDRILEIDLQRRSVRTVMESDEIVSIAGSDRLFPIPKKDELVRRIHRKGYLAVRLKDRVLVIAPHGTEHRTYLLPEAVRQKGFSLYDRSEGPAILQAQRGKARSPVDLYWIPDSAEVVRSETVALETIPGVVLLNLRTVYLSGPRGIEDPRIISALGSLVSPVPALWGVATTVGFPVAYLRSGEAGSYPAALAKSFSDIWPGVLISLALSAVAVWLCLKRQRQYAAPWTRTWAVFVFLFGIPGLLGYLFCRRWPPREECPACSQEAPRDRESCSACGAEFPEPPPKGIEVFA